MVTITKNPLDKVKEVAYKYFDKYRKMGSEWVGIGDDGFALEIGGFFTREEIGGIYLFREGIDINIYDKQYLLEIKKICELIEKKEKIDVDIELTKDR